MAFRYNWSRLERESSTKKILKRKQEKTTRERKQNSDMT